MSTTVLRPYIDAIADLPQEAFLGSMVFFTISEADVELEKAREEILALKLSLDGLRKGMAPHHAFAKAARDCAHRFTADSDVRSEVLVRPFGSDADTVRKALMLERFEYNEEAGKKRRISYDKVAELILHRGEKTKGVYVGHSVETMATEGISLTGQEDEWLAQTLAGFSFSFHHHLTHLDSHAVRTFVREYIGRLGGVCIKESGGVYFTRQAHADEVGRLASWVQGIGSQFHTVTLLNLVGERAMILQALEDESVKEVERLMAEVAAILKDPHRSIEEKTFNNYGIRAAELRKKLETYASMLDARAERAGLEISIFARQLMQLVGRIAA